MKLRDDRRLTSLLESLTDSRMLTLSQLAHLHFGSRRAARRRMRQLCSNQLAVHLPIMARYERGRPEGVFGLGKKGFQCLREEGRFSDEVLYEHVDGIRLAREAEHQMLLNWCRIHLVHMSRQMPRLALRFLAVNACLRESAALGPLLAPTLNDQEPARFYPDATILISDQETRESALFFLEIDRGTEPFWSRDPIRHDIRQKAFLYKEYFRSGEYRRHEELTVGTLRGFRVLFLTESRERLRSLAWAIRRIPETSFIWLSSSDQMFADGITGMIWMIGGSLETPLGSILDRHAFSAPLPFLPA